jgi:hypothetical protein
MSSEVSITPTSAKPILQRRSEDAQHNRAEIKTHLASRDKARATPLSLSWQTQMQPRTVVMPFERTKGEFSEGVVEASFLAHSGFMFFSVETHFPPLQPPQKGGGPAPAGHSIL